MKINRTRIRNLDRYLGWISDGTSFRVIFPVTDEKMISRLGFTSEPGNGETILPNIVGPITRFNADGRWLTRRDLPKGRRYIRTVSWRWTTWDGDEHEDYRDIYRDCYPRELIAPPSVELTYLEKDGAGFIVSPEQIKSLDTTTSSLHVVNLFLELFHTCEIATADLAALSPPILRQANWKLLPAGAYPWDKVDEHVQHAVQRMNGDARGMILGRQEMLKSLEPDECWVGEGGFDDYMAYVFKAQGLVVLECLQRDNALYLFTGDWRPVSRLTKAQILQNDLHHARIVHSKGWQARLASHFKKRAA